MKPIKLDKIKEKKCIIKWANYIIQVLKIIMVNILNYQMLKKKYKKQFKPKNLKLEGDEEVKNGKEWNNLTSSKLLTRLPILLTQIKAGINS